MPRNNTKSRRIILELLHKPDGTLTKYRIAKSTETNLSWVISFLRKLEDKKIVIGTKVKKFDELIDYYLSIDAENRHLDFHLPQPLDYLKKTNSPYALTTYSAENLISHHLFPSRTDVYIKEEDLEKWKKALFSKGLAGKGNLRLIIAADNYLFKFTQRIGGLSLVTSPLLMIDLKREDGVCIQAYEYLVKKHVQR